MNYLLTFAFCLFGFTAFGQQQITLTGDMNRSEPLVITEDTVFDGKNFTLSCDDCRTAIIVEEGVTVHFKDVIFKRGYQRWARVKKGGYMSWNSRRMQGHMSTSR